MVPFFKKYWINILAASVLLLVLFCLSDEQDRYLRLDFRALRDRSRTVFLWINIAGGLLVFLLGIPRDHKRKKILHWGFRCVLGALFSLLSFRDAFVSATLFVNRSSNRGTVEKAYVVVHTYPGSKWPLLLKDSSLNKNFSTKQLKNGNAHIKEDDTLIIVFSKGLFNVDFDPRIKEVRKAMIGPVSQAGRDVEQGL